MGRRNCQTTSSTPQQTNPLGCWQLQFDKFLTPSSINVLEDMIQKPSKFLFRFSLGCHVMDQRSGDGRFSGWILSSRSIAGKDFSNSELLDAKIASVLNKIPQNSQFKKVSLEEQKAEKEDRFRRGLFSSYRCSCRSWLRWFIFHHSSWR